MTEDEGSRREEIRRGAEAAALLESPLLQEAFDGIEAALMEAWRKSPAGNVQDREDCWRSVKLLGKIKAHLRSYVQTGKLAAQQLDLMADRANGGTTNH